MSDHPCNLGQSQPSTGDELFQCGLSHAPDRQAFKSNKTRDLNTHTRLTTASSYDEVAVSDTPVILTHTTSDFVFHLNLSFFS